MTIESNPVTSGVRRFDEIEGLRGWLSWTVVAWHLIQYTGLNGRFRILGSTAGLAHLAVELFIILSGFVVAHLLSNRTERYPRYLARRAFRLFPLYLVMAAIGAITTGLAAQAVLEVPWTNDPAFTYRDALLPTFASQQAHLPLHALLHLTLLQGVVPDSLLPYSSVVFLGPAWSLSLEWQFYLIAPVVVGALRRPVWAAPMTLLLVAGFLACRLGWLGEYRLMSVFPAAALLFLTGIASRLAFQRIAPTIGSPVAVALIGVLIGVLAPEFIAAGLWIGFYAFLVTFGRGGSGGIDVPASRIWAELFGSRPARWFGARSYGVYLAHWPILQATLWALRRVISADTLVAAATLAAIVLPTTLVAAELLHRGVEKPMIRLGAALLNGRRAEPAP